MTWTHDLTLRDGIITKRYASWLRGEPGREWAALRAISADVDDLAPRPVTADLDAQPPWISMTRVPGESLRRPVTGKQLDAVAEALGALWCVPIDGLGLEAARNADVGLARARLAACARPMGGVAAEAYAAAASWLKEATLDYVGPVSILGHADPNLANYLWDGQRVRIVDFEDAGRSDVALELGTLIEHLSWRGTDAEALPSRLAARGFAVDEERLLVARRVWAIFWLALLLPGGPAAARNPPGTAEEQASRVIALLSR